MGESRFFSVFSVISVVNCFWVNYSQELMQ